MNEEPINVIMAVENNALRDALLSALTPLLCSPLIILPEALLQTELSGANLIFLETSNDVERLIRTIQELWTKWGQKDDSDVWFVSYSTLDVTPDSVIFRLWGIGPEMTVSVQPWRPGDLAELQKNAYKMVRYYLEGD